MSFHPFSYGRLTNLPEPLNSFVGQKRALTEIKRILTDTRLLNLTGPGGCGKTRLAIEVARSLLDRFPDGTWLVELASLTDPELVMQEIASVLGIQEQSPHLLTLVEKIQSRHMLLVLDNCEHLLPACVQTCEMLLRRCPHLTIIATSRERFDMPGEVAWTVAPLTFPDLSTSFLFLAPADLMKYEAIRLFAERASAALPSFELTEQNAGAVGQVCAYLDGMPLAIELAAAHVKILSPEQIAKRLEDRFSLIKGKHAGSQPRQQTLRATVDWSHDLLSEQEQALFARLAVFAGYFTWEALIAIAGEEGLAESEVFELLTHLVDKSMITVEQRGGRAWYRLLEMLRQYGWEKLRQRGEADAMRERHRDWYVELALQQLPGMAYRDQAAWLEYVELEHDNLRAALVWTQKREQIEVVARLCLALWTFWRLRSHLSEGRRWLEASLVERERLPLLLRASISNALGVLATMQGDYAEARGLHEESLALLRPQGSKAHIAFTLHHLAYIAERQGRYEQAQTLLQESLELFSTIANVPGLALAYLLMGNVVMQQGDYERAKECYQESLHLRRQMGDRVGVASALNNLGDLARLQGDYKRAGKLFEQSLASFQELGDRTATAIAQLNLGLVALAQSNLECAESFFVDALKLFWMVGDKTNLAETLEGLGRVALARRQRKRATLLASAANHLHTTLGSQPPKSSHMQELITSVRSLQDEQFFADLWAAGQDMPLEQMLVYACTKEAIEAPSTSLLLPSSEISAQCEERLPSRLRIFSLGQVDIWRGEDILTSSDWVYVKGRELLFYLLCHGPRTKEQIGLALWPEASSTQLRNIFRVTLYHLRRALGSSEWIIFDGERYAFHRSASCWFDVEHFEAGITEAEELFIHSPDRAVSCMEEALKLYHGDFLEGATGGDWAIPRRDELRQRYVEALLTLGKWYFTQEHYDRAVAVFQRAITCDPYHESAHYALMQAYTRLGQRSQALACYQALVVRMRDDLGGKPGQETQVLYDLLRQGEAV